MKDVVVSADKTTCKYWRRRWGRDWKTCFV